jgi:hypothetical protein
MFSPEYSLLLLSCKLDDHATTVKEAERLLSAENINWDDLYERACFHGIKSQLADLLERMSPSLVSPYILEKLSEALQDNLIRQLKHVAEFMQIRDWLAGERIQIIPYKGFWLGDAIYGNLAERESFDIDLFIDLNDLERIKSIMTQRGYILQETLTNLTDEYIFKELAEYNFEKYSGEICISHIEFHWRSSMTFYRMDIDMNDLKPQIITGRIRDNEVKVFSPAANLLLAVIHHGGKECYAQLRQILDIAHIIRRHPNLDYEWLFQMAERFNIKSLLCLGIRLASDLMSVNVPAAFTDYVNKGRIVRLAGGRVRLAAKPVYKLDSYKASLRSWVFKIHSRDGLNTKLHLFYYTLRKVLAPRLVPEKWRYLFFNRKITSKQPAVNGI